MNTVNVGDPARHAAMFQKLKPPRVRLYDPDRPTCLAQTTGCCTETAANYQGVRSCTDGSKETPIGEPIVVDEFACGDTLTTVSVVSRIPAIRMNASQKRGDIVGRPRTDRHYPLRMEKERQPSPNSAPNITTPTRPPYRNHLERHRSSVRHR